jgi:alpha-beta hydrolase superfamily lysophospholipase
MTRLDNTIGCTSSVLTRRAAPFLAIVILLFVQACDGPALEPWHTEELTQEFTAEKASEIQTFDDYRRLEDKLFAELEEKVYGHVETGPAHALERYSAGSAADPQARNPNWNRSFELSSHTPVGGVLLLHGMSDSPYSLRVLGEALNQQNYWVVGLRLPGHGTAPSGLKHISLEDLTAAVALGMSHLASKVDGKPVHMVGYSTGGPLAVDFSLDALDGRISPVPASLVLISPAIGIHPAVALAKWKNRLAMLPGLERLAWTQILPEFDPYKYNSFATNAGEVVHRLTRSVASRIRSRARSGGIEDFPPTLVFQSTVDSTVSTDAIVDRLLSHLPPDRNELVLFDLNRYAVKSLLLVSDPGPATARLMADDTLPFAVTLVTNETPKTTKVQAFRKPPFASKVSEAEPLNLSWPVDVVSLSHVALPIPPDDPLYGQRPPGNEDVLFLGQMPIQGERGLLKLSGDWLLRLRHNPFYVFLQTTALAWIDAANNRTADSDNAAN